MEFNKDLIFKYISDYLDSDFYTVFEKYQTLVIIMKLVNRDFIVND
uniref:Uncharacterized protein n=1 Tax=Dulem virus 59 TaxID=3145770 RepID=A0AAU8B5Y1_9VIRU